MKKMIMGVLGVFCCMGVQASEAEQESEGLRFPFTVNQGDGVEPSITFKTRENIEDYLKQASGQDEFDEIKPKEGEDMNAYMQRNPMFVLNCQTRFAVVRECSYGYWDHLLETLPGKTYTVKTLVEEIDRITTLVSNEVKAEVNDPSIEFGLAMEMGIKRRGFLALFGIGQKSE